MLGMKNRANRAATGKFTNSYNVYLEEKEKEICHKIEC